MQTCLARHGISAQGGPYFGPNLAVRPHPMTPIGELVLTSVPPPPLIAFYVDAHAARRAEPGVIRNIRRTGGEVERQGLVTIAWVKPPSQRLRVAVHACTF